MEKREFVPVSGNEQVQVARALIDWMNQYTDFPFGVKKIEAEFLPAQGNGIGLFATTAAYKTNEYIDGSYAAQYQFSLQYRTAPASTPQRLNAMDALTEIAAWAEKRDDLPGLGDGKISVSIERMSPAVMIARYEDGSEDYQILMTFDYEVKA